MVSYCDQMKIKKKQINTIDPLAYTYDAFIGDIFENLKTAPVEAFESEYKRQEIDWTMGKPITSESLSNKTSLH
jgi:hypothetical protein